MEMITQKQAEDLVYQDFLNDGYTEKQIIENPYRVAIVDDNVIVTSIDETWKNTFKIEYIPKLIFIP